MYFLKFSENNINYLLWQNSFVQVFMKATICTFFINVTCNVTKFTTRS